MMRRTAAIACVVLGMSCLTAQLQADEISASLPDSITASYQVRLGKTLLGVIEKTLNRDGNIYRVSSDARPNALVKLVAGGEAHEEAIFMLTDQGLQSLFYSETRTGKPLRKVEFDWDTRMMTFDRGGEVSQEPVPDMETVDASSLPFYLMLKNIKDLDGKMIAVVTGKRVGQYRFETPAPETIEIEDATLKTWRIVKNRVGATDNAITVWVDPQRRNLPVKIVQKRGDRITTLTLASISGL